MFGLLDWIYSYFVDQEKHSYDSPNYKKVIIDRNSNETWFCFLPPLVSSSKILLNRIIPKKGNIILFCSSSIPVYPNPKVMKSFLDEVYFDAKKELNKEKKKKHSINILSVSLPNVLGFRLAKDAKPKKMIAIVPGANLSDSIYESLITWRQREDAAKKGFYHHEFAKALKNYVPEKYAHFAPKDIKVYISKWDGFIPYDQGKKLVDVLKKKGKTPIVKVSKIWGHIGSIILFKIKN